MSRLFVVLDCSAVREPDAELVDALARLQLHLMRGRCELRLANASPALAGLIEFAGLSRVLTVEPGRQPKQRKETGRVQKERDLDDASI